MLNQMTSFVLLMEIDMNGFNTIFKSTLKRLSSKRITKEMIAIYIVMQLASDRQLVLPRS